MCIYKDSDGHCALYSSATVTSYCVEGPCPDEALTNADRIRAMSDEELATELIPMMEELCEDGMPSEEYMRFWLQQPVKEDNH